MTEENESISIDEMLKKLGINVGDDDMDKDARFVQQMSDIQAIVTKVEIAGLVPVTSALATAIKENVNSDDRNVRGHEKEVVELCCHMLLTSVFHRINAELNPLQDRLFTTIALAHRIYEHAMAEQQQVTKTHTHIRKTLGQLPDRSVEDWAARFINNAHDVIVQARSSSNSAEADC